MYLCFAAVGGCQSPLGHARAHSSHNLLQSVYLAVAGAGAGNRPLVSGRAGPVSSVPWGGGEWPLWTVSVVSSSGEEWRVTTLPVDAGGAVFSRNKHVCR